MWVIKIGGGAGNAIEPLLDELCSEHRERPWILVHGGSKRLDEVSTALGHPPRTLVSPSGYTSRRTDRRTALTMAMVLAGEINQRIVESLQARGVDAFGLSGLDGGLVRARRKRAIRAVEDGRWRHRSGACVRPSLNLPARRRRSRWRRAPWHRRDGCI